MTDAFSSTARLSTSARPREAIRYGIGLVPENRKQQALFLSLAIRMNVSVASLDQLKRWLFFVNEPAEKKLVGAFRRALNIRMASPEQLVVNLSDGNCPSEPLLTTGHGLMLPDIFLLPSDIE